MRHWYQHSSSPSLVSPQGPAMPMRRFRTARSRLSAPFAPGGPIDAIARPLAAAMQEILGATVVVESRSGAGGIIGSETVVSAPPDGYTLLMTTGSHIGNKVFNPTQVRYDPLQGFTPIMGLIETNGIDPCCTQGHSGELDCHAQYLCEKPAEWPDLRPCRHWQHFVHRRGVAQAAGRHSAFRGFQIVAQPPP